MKGLETSQLASLLAWIIDLLWSLGSQFKTKTKIFWVESSSLLAFKSTINNRINNTLPESSPSQRRGHNWSLHESQRVPGFKSTRYQWKITAEVSQFKFLAQASCLIRRCDHFQIRDGLWHTPGNRINGIEQNVNKR